MYHHVSPIYYLAPSMSLDKFLVNSQAPGQSDASCDEHLRVGLTMGGGRKPIPQVDGWISGKSYRNYRQIRRFNYGIIIIDCIPYYYGTSWLIFLLTIKGSPVKYVIVQAGDKPIRVGENANDMPLRLHDSPSIQETRECRIFVSWRLSIHGI